MDIIDLSSNNCWLVKLMPFETDERNNDIVVPYQENCRKKKIFGMGWRDENADSKIKEDGKKCLETYKQIKTGDFIVTRFRNSKVYIGRVKAHHDNSPVFFFTMEDVFTDCLGNPTSSRISYGCEVEEWYECKNNTIPSEIVGRLSQKRQSTIQRVASNRQQILIRAMYEYASNNIKEFAKYRVKYHLGNFARCLNYMELEDLVALYILQQKNNYGYILKPSSCKVSEIKYEFVFICPERNRKPITCQVKNQAAINISDYYNCGDFEKIYLFSGLWDDETAKMYQDEADMKSNNVTIIQPSELYQTLRDNINMFVNQYYEETTTKNSQDIIKILEKYDYKKRSKGTKWQDFSFEQYCYVNLVDSDEKGNDNNGDDIVFRYGIFYSSDFDAIIIPNRYYDNAVAVRKKAEDIRNILTK